MALGPAFAGTTTRKLNSADASAKTTGPDNTVRTRNRSHAEGDGQNSKCSDAM